MRNRKQGILLPASAIDTVTFRVAKASAHEAGRLAALHASALPPGWPEADIAAYCGGETRTVLKVEQDRVVQGLIVLQFAAEEAEILSVAVSEDKRRCGIGASLIKAALDICRVRLISCIYLEVAEGNKPARNLYEKLGFKIIATRSNYYQSQGIPRENAIVMRLDIGQAASLVDLGRTNT